MQISSYSAFNLFQTNDVPPLISRHVVRHYGVAEARCVVVKGPIGSPWSNRFLDILLVSLKPPETKRTIWCVERLGSDIQARGLRYEPWHRKTCWRSLTLSLGRPKRGNQGQDPRHFREEQLPTARTLLQDEEQTIKIGVTCACIIRLVLSSSPFFRSSIQS
jgi:hypothetical protein